MSPVEGLGALPLTGRELETLRLAALGLTQRQMAEAMFVSKSTVRNYMASLCRKLAAKNAAQAVAVALRGRMME